MRQFDYVAQSVEDGSKIEGQVSSENQQGAIQKLKEKGLVVLKMKKTRPQFFSEKAKVHFTQRLHLLLKSGLPLYESLLFLQQESANKEKRIFIRLAQKLRQGQSFSLALKEVGVFEPLYLALIQSGEERGDLGDALMIVADLMDQRQKLKKNILSALSYPLFIAVFALVCFYVLLLFVIPSFENFFEGMELPAFTRFIFHLSSLLQNHPLTLPLALFSLLVMAIVLRPKNILWRVPILKTLSLQRDLYLFSKAFSHLHKADVDLLTTLELTQNLVVNPTLREGIAQMQEEVKKGGQLSRCFEKLNLKLSFFVQMIKVGEQSANLSGAFDQIATYYQSILEHRIKRLIQFLQPIVLLLVAGLIGVIMLSILVPMTDVSRFIDF